VFPKPYPPAVAACLLAVATLVLAAGGAAAKSLDIAAFYGKWQGHAMSESDISVHFQMTSRDIGIEIEPSTHGFKLTWNTVQRQRGDPNNPVEKLKSTTIRFREARAGVWRGISSRDPLHAVEPYAWAHIVRQTLVVTVLQIELDGSHELQIYRRTITGGPMELEFTRIVNGRQVRTAKGRLIKVGN
jgi:hypothetical protein